ncbi:uncharacterized protein LOC143546662 [Bidens hawaiensis]|uniref:uncharacterized protein LOC143546662 n=1 Tax=Bidens hawaiensis TaxID=980011 RepID=UPI004049BA2B
MTGKELYDIHKDDVLVNPEGLNNKLWVAKMKKFVGNKVRISWYYMPILYSDHIDEVSIDVIEKSFKVYLEEQYEDFKEVDADVYLCRSKYDPVNKVFTKDTNSTAYATLFT